MDNKITLKAKAEDDQPLEVVFWPERGMNFISYKKAGVEVIDQTTWDLFEERYAGLGAMIGPHFHHRNYSIISKIQDESLFPHIARVKAKGTQEPFSHGIGRYAPWKEEHTETKIRATLAGKDTWNGVPLAELEGQDFKMQYEAELTPKGLRIFLSVVSETDSVVGLHTYYRLTGGGRVIAKVLPQFNDHGEIKPIPKQWSYGEDFTLDYPLVENTDYGFYPYPDPLEGHIFLKTNDYHLKIFYRSLNQENSWQLYHPQGKSFVCIEPLSAKDPRKPHLSVSSLHTLITII